MKATDFTEVKNFIEGLKNPITSNNLRKENPLLATIYDLVVGKLMEDEKSLALSSEQTNQICAEKIVTLIDTNINR